MQRVDKDQESQVPDSENGTDGNWIFNALATIIDFVGSGVCRKMWEVQNICKKDNEAVSTSVVEVGELARD